MKTTLHRRFFVIVAVAMVTVALSACGGSGDSEDGPVQTVVLREWAVTKSLVDAPAGELKFRVRNNGSLEHELLVIKTQLPADNLPIDDAQSVVDVGASGPLAGELLNIGGSNEKTETFNLSPGQYVLICNLPGHYQQGMRTSFTVQ